MAYNIISGIPEGINPDRFPKGLPKDYVFVPWERNPLKVADGGKVLISDMNSVYHLLSLYDLNQGKGGFAFCSGLESMKSPLHPDKVVDTLLKRMGVAAEECCDGIVATLSGEGAHPKNMYSESRPSFRIKKALDSKQIPVMAEDLGNIYPSHGRIVKMDCRTGDIGIYRIPSYC